MDPTIPQTIQATTNRQVPPIATGGPPKPNHRNRANAGGGMAIVASNMRRRWVSRSRRQRMPSPASTAKLSTVAIGTARNASGGGPPGGVTPFRAAVMAVA